MIHKDRRHFVKRYASLAVASLKFTARGNTWTLCTGFAVGDLVFLNDAFSEDGAAEYAVFRDLGGNELLPVESFTLSWMERREFIRACHELCIGPAKTETIERGHPRGSCRLCA